MAPAEGITSAGMDARGNQVALMRHGAAQLARAARLAENEVREGDVNTAGVTAIAHCLIGFAEAAEALLMALADDLARS